MIQWKKIFCWYALDLFDHQFSMHLGNFLVWEEMAHRMSAEKDDELRLYERQLLMQPLLAAFNLFWKRVSVVRRAVFDDIGDVYVLALHLDAFKHLRKEFAGCTDKGLSLHVLILSGCFADEYDIRIRIPVAKDRLGGSFFERTIAFFVPCLMQCKQFFRLIHTLGVYLGFWYSGHMGIKSFLMKKALQMKGVPKDQAEQITKQIEENPELAASLKTLESNPEVKALFEKIQKEIEEEKKKGMNEQYAMITVMGRYKSEIAKHREALEPLVRLFGR